MKKIYLLFTSLFLFISADAQPVLTGANSNPVPGDAFIFNQGSSSTLPLLIGNGGANQTWVIFMPPTTNSSTTSFVSASSTPYFSSFPGSDVAIPNGNSEYDYYIASSSEFTLLGGANVTSTAVYNDPQKQMSFPFQFNDSFYDTFNDTGSAGSFYFGNTNATADGYGTLFLPTGTFSNVLRIHSIYNYYSVDSLFPDSIIDDGFYFYQPGFHHVLFAFAKVQSSMNGAIYTTYEYGYTEQSSVGIADPAFSKLHLAVFPNPVRDKINLEFINQEPGHMKIRLTDVSGKKVKEINFENLPDGEIKETISVNELTPGMYFLDALTDENHYTEKIVIE